MISEKDLTVRPDTSARSVSPIFPTNSVEFVNALSHYYRGEMARMMSWRDRLDRTTNWAITGVGAMLSLSLSSPQSHHGVLLFAMLLVFLLLFPVNPSEMGVSAEWDGKTWRVNERHQFTEVTGPGGVLGAPDPVRRTSIG